MTKDQAREYILAGKAIVTLKSAKTGKHLTYSVRQKDDVFFVGVLTGSNNNGDYSFLGTIFEGRRFFHGRKSSIAEDAVSAITWRWFWGQMLSPAPELPDGLEVLHNDHCGRCGRLLTHPESIESGLGPVCAGRA